ncbi:radical SAM protein [Streptomyces sp. MMS24-I2-30]|uniref:radical SAM protein n=1 Tax=Streptomyces sp. MMS24-I2-30 TaxID=3351564 RepID=UPI003896D5A9
MRRILTASAPRDADSDGNSRIASAQRQVWRDVTPTWAPERSLLKMARIKVMTHQHHANSSRARARRSDVPLANPPPGTRLASIRDHLESMGAPRFRYRQVVTAMRRGKPDTFESIHGLPADLRRSLTERFGPRLLPIVPVSCRSAEQVEKVIFESDPGTRFETVLSRYRAGWSSICVSSQAGCGLGCTFCATGATGLARNLTADEIYAQVMHPRWRPQDEGLPDSVAFMGMGEALANPHVFDALTLLSDSGFGDISPRRITVSTVGFAPNLQTLTKEHPQVTITLSVHSPFSDERARLIPLERRFPLGDSLAILDEHAAVARRKIYLAYLLIAGVNDTQDHMHRLARIVAARSRPELFHVSVIRYNQAVGADPAFHAPSSPQVNRFVAGLRALGVHATRRRQFGSSIDAACGQLHARYVASTASGDSDVDQRPTASAGHRLLRVLPPDRQESRPAAAECGRRAESHR